MPEDYVSSYYAATRTTLSGGEPRPPLEGVVQAETCVVGGGLAGLSTALELAERGRTVVLLESRRVGWGASGRNGGMVGAGFSLALPRIIDRLGMEDARALYRLSAEGVETVRRRVRDHAIDCAPMHDGVLGTTWFDEADRLRRHAAFMAEHFGEAYEFWSKDRIREVAITDRYQAGLLNRGRFMLHPLNYCRGVACAVEAAGAAQAVVHEGTPVTAVEPDGAGHRVLTAGGEVRCRHVVVACGGYIERLVLELARAIVPVATYVIATEPLGEEKLATALRTRYGISDNRLANDYYRALPDTRILWGGRMSVRRSRPPNLSALMLRDLLGIYPQLAGARVESAWHGLMSYPAHKMPLVGELRPGFWYAMGFGGHGLNTTTMAGAMVAGAIAEGDDRHRLLAPFGLLPTGGPVGAGAAQLTYWYYQLLDAWRGLGASRRAG